MSRFHCKSSPDAKIFVAPFFKNEATSCGTLSVQWLNFSIYMGCVCKLYDQSLFVLFFEIKGCFTHVNFTVAAGPGTKTDTVC